MTNRYQQNAARWMCEDRHEAESELDIREQLKRDQRARDIRRENARRVEAAS